MSRLKPGGRDHWKDYILTFIWMVLYLKRNWGGHYGNVAVLVAMAVNERGEREVIGAAEGMKEDKESRLSFLRHLMFVGDKCLGLIEALIETYPLARFQRCMVHFYRNVFSVVPRGKVKQVAAMLKAIHAQEDKGAALDKLEDVVGKLKKMKLFEAAKKVEETGIETLMYMDFPREHWRRIRSNNAMERLNREIRRIPRRPVCVDVSVCQVEAPEFPTFAKNSVFIEEN